MLRRKEVFQLPAEFGFRKIVESSDLNPDPCNDGRAGYQSRKRVSGLMNR